MANEKNNKPSKYDQAVNRARGVEPESTAVTTTGPTEIDITTLPDGMVIDSREAMAMLAEKVKSGEWEAAPQLLTLKPRQTLIAYLEGNGPEAEFTDDATGEVSSTKTWILSKNGVRVSILDTVQLAKKLPPFIGGLVSITRGEDKRSGTRIYTEYLVVGPMRADGKPRDWSGLNDQRQLAAPAPSSPAAAASAEDLT